VSSSSTINAVLEAAVISKNPIIVQVASPSLPPACDRIVDARRTSIDVEA